MKRFADKLEEIISIFGDYAFMGGLFLVFIPFCILLSPILIPAALVGWVTKKIGLWE